MKNGAKNTFLRTGATRFRKKVKHCLTNRIYWKTNGPSNGSSSGNSTLPDRESGRHLPVTQQQRRILPNNNSLLLVQLLNTHDFEGKGVGWLRPLQSTMDNGGKVHARRHPPHPSLTSKLGHVQNTCEVLSDLHTVAHHRCWRLIHGEFSRLVPPIRDSFASGEKFLPTIWVIWKQSSRRSSTCVRQNLCGSQSRHRNWRSPWHWWRAKGYRWIIFRGKPSWKKEYDTKDLMT